MDDIIREYFIRPIISPEISGYNLINTTIFILLLVIACYLIYKFLNKKIEFDKDFFVSLIPYIFFGISMRVIMHQIESKNLVIEGLTKTANPLQAGFWFFTPGIWILTFIIVCIGLIIGGILNKEKVNKSGLKKIFYFGIIIALIPLLFNFSKFNNWPAFIITTIILVTASSLVYYLTQKFTKYKIDSSKINYFIVLGQGIDGIASVIAITFFNFSEQHVFSNILINIHPLLFVIVKFSLAILICYSLDDYLIENPKQKNLVNFIKLVIAILGFATGGASLIKLGII